MLNVKFVWKHWYWYFVLIVNFGSTLLMGTRAQLQTTFASNSTLDIVFLSLTSCALMICLLIYLIYTTKETRLCKTLIKPERTKFLQFGSFFAFMVINSYWALGLAGYKLSAAWPFWVSFGLTILFGIFSSILLTFYEFCISFDVYYHRHKSEIVHDFFRKFKESEVPAKVEEAEEVEVENIENK